MNSWLNRYAWPQTLWSEKGKKLIFSFVFSLSISLCKFKRMKTKIREQSMNERDEARERLKKRENNAKKKTEGLIGTNHH